MPARAPVTKLLQDWRDGNERALDQLTPAVYTELKKLAVAVFRGENPGHTLQPTALVNEAFMQLVDTEVDWQDRAHFFAMAARMMRRILVNHANAKRAVKRGGGARPLSLDESLVVAPGPNEQVLALDELITQLAEFDQRKAQIIELHYFGGLTQREISETLGISTSTLERDIALAKAWLRKNMSDEAPAS